MTIREVTYYEAWCDAPDGAHRIEFGDYTAFGSPQRAADEVPDADGVIDRKTGQVYCYDHILHCGAERSTVEAVQP